MKVAFASLRSDRSLQILEGFQESEAPIHHQSPCSPGCQPRPTLPTWQAQPSSGAPSQVRSFLLAHLFFVLPMPCPSLEALWGPGSEGAALAVAVQRVPGWDAKKNSKYCTVGVPVITPCPRAISSWPEKDNATHALCTNTHTHACTHTHMHSGTHTADSHARPLPDPLRPIHTGDWTHKYTHRPHTHSGQGWSQRI